MNKIKSELRRTFYSRLQVEYNRMRERGIDKTIILEILADRYCVTKTSIRNNISTNEVDVQAYESAREIYGTLNQ